MFSIKDFKRGLFKINAANFDEQALLLFHYQYQSNIVYHDYVNAIRSKPQNIRDAKEIPFLPIDFFKTHRVICGDIKPEIIFESSGTTQTINSRHYVADIDLYKNNCMEIFTRFYGGIKDYVILGLLPSYLERNNSSLVYMVQQWMQQSGQIENGFYLNNLENLYSKIISLEQQKRNYILIGVTFALLDFAEKYSMQLKRVTMMETGGMKGRRKEITRNEVHDILKNKLGINAVHAEYGMTELLSQAYSKQDGIFCPPPWMKVFVREENDPLQVHSSGTGIINIIDLANIHSCAFIATDDVGKVHADGSFEVLGRMDNSALRGCSLMIV